ncbi:MAG: hypothetical protein WCB49_11240 [Gammaproteobacteria bacterium]
MTANDKTGEKLVDSMRKTKAAAATKAEAPQSVQKQPRAQKPQPRTRKKAASRGSSQGTREQRGDPYQSGRRVWPD